MCEIRKNAMQKKQFQQNMKDKVRVFEDGGIRLLKRGQKGVVHAIFSRFGLVLVLLLLQAFALFSLLQWFGELLPHYFGGTLLVTAAMMVYLLNQDMDNMPNGAVPVHLSRLPALPTLLLHLQLNIRRRARFLVLVVRFSQLPDR